MAEHVTFQHYGDEHASVVLVHVTGEEESEMLPSIYDALHEACDSLLYIAVIVTDWDAQLSLWPCEAPFGQSLFAGGASETYAAIMAHLSSLGGKHHYLMGGYSLAGLFSLYCGYTGTLFEGIAAMSPSLWFPGWSDYTETHTMNARCVYLSLGTREHKVRNKTMAQIKKHIIRQHDILVEQEKTCTLVYHPGNHFQDVDQRIISGFTWLLAGVQDEA